VSEGDVDAEPDAQPGLPGHPDLHGLLALAESAAAGAASMLAARRSAGRPGVVATKSSPTDVVTEADRAAETMITARILGERPGDLILGEEGGLHGGKASSSSPGDATGAGEATVYGGTGGPAVRWIVDPLDGTVNYVYGLPDFAVSIAAEVNGTIAAAVVHVPERAEVYTAIAGQGAWLRAAGRPPVRLRCNQDVHLARALVATGFGYSASRRKTQGEVVAAMLPLVRDIRRAGSAAVDLCSVAAGRVDAYYERGVNYWDFAAGGLVATEAGAVLGGLSGKPPGSALTIAAPQPLFTELHDQLAKLNPERDAPE
jgi:myo-inositol-1(or 4)-monophosphatase